MTREEAITVFKAFMDNPLFSDVHKAAFNIAIHDIKAHHDWDISNLILINKDNYEPTTKNDLGVDCISRAEAIKCLECDFDITGKENMKTVVNYINSAHDKIVNLPRVKQEPFNPMVEIDLYSVIKQKYIEREVLDKIYADIQRLRGCSCSCSDGIIDDVEDILDKYKAESEAEE